MTARHNAGVHCNLLPALANTTSEVKPGTPSGARFYFIRLLRDRELAAEVLGLGPDPLRGVSFDLAGGFAGSCGCVGR